ncbi:hypothetical protein [Frankia sp. AgB32]|uniref:hypothetical protein n=1 Tax=Frankia sp. AgB32 TaxID=631119 RepID=UPI00200C2C28|nr:hypothetical protein [Frankia sp. AgB32]MCK9893881.1 hypothetical protein [Frankia sp. AgB32]
MTDGAAELRPAPARGWRSNALAGLICAAAMVVVGFPLGLLWAAAAPHLNMANALQGNESAFAVQSDIDARFGLICAVAGVIGGAVAFWRARDAGWPVPLGLAGGGLGGALTAGGRGHPRRAPGGRHSLPGDASPVLVDLVDLRVRAHGLYLIMPVVALVVFAVALWAASWPQRAGTAGRPRRHATPTAPAAPIGGFGPDGGDGVREFGTADRNTGGDSAGGRGMSAFVAEASESRAGRVGAGGGAGAGSVTAGSVSAGSVSAARVSAGWVSSGWDRPGAIRSNRWW